MTVKLKRKSESEGTFIKKAGEKERERQREREGERERERRGRITRLSEHARISSYRMRRRER